MQWWHWLAVGLILVALEMAASGGFYVIFFGVAAVVVAILQLAGVSGPLWTQLLLFSVLSVVSLLVFRSPLMRWYPIVTFGQVAADVTNAAGAPAGHGHNYGETVLDGWAAVIPPDGWTAQDTDRVRVALVKATANGGPEY